MPAFSEDDYDLLRPETDRMNGVEYRMVYPQNKVRRLYAAYATKNRLIGRYLSQRQAATAILTFYSEYYGDNWREVLKHCQKRSIVFRTSQRGVEVDVWFRGEKHSLKLAGSDRTHFPTKSAAEEAVENFLMELLGLMNYQFRDLECYRLD